ncbi:hypothetical protein EUTSA_v10019176mg [Eutrema salsugineum]|uniref:Uncharacterized protein n=1 Tax=Eutrema salsugineum TaxID=72664 RepID=V4MC56_EUTSA|nr:uncharacterized protein LOC18008284 [Eutrema salsugineum]ESQ28806.1 hypothetical protein EUTSA_v10019176mg [Eutrema salsugineum]
MATSSSSSYLFLLIAIIVSSLSVSTIAARPCKTFLISSYSLSITPEENPNHESDLSSTRFVTVFTIRRLNPHPIVPFFVNRRHGFLPSAVEKPQIQRSEDDRAQSAFPMIFDNINSFRDRTRDILSVVVALLFGVGCGALTAATMYLVWALVVNRHSYNFEEDDFENDESDEASLKKLGYVKIPAPVSAPVKEAA